MINGDSHDVPLSTNQNDRPQEDADCSAAYDAPAPATGMVMMRPMTLLPFGAAASSRPSRRHVAHAFDEEPIDVDQPDHAVGAARILRQEWSMSMTPIGTTRGLEVGGLKLLPTIGPFQHQRRRVPGEERLDAVLGRSDHVAGLDS